VALRASKKARKDDWGEVAIEAWEGFGVHCSAGVDENVNVIELNL
jgi:hypothetical protein